MLTENDVKRILGQAFGASVFLMGLGITFDAPAEALPVIALPIIAALARIEYLNTSEPLLVRYIPLQIDSNMAGNDDHDQTERLLPPSITAP